MPGDKRIHHAITRRRLVAGASVILLIAALSLFNGHHHLNESDTSTCLICNGVSAPAIQAPDATPPVVHLDATPLPFHENELRIAPGSPGANTVRAPPSC